MDIVVVARPNAKDRTYQAKYAAKWGVQIAGMIFQTETALPEMNEKMYAAGLQNIIDEKQAQLDKWLESKGE